MNSPGLDMNSPGLDMNSPELDMNSPESLTRYQVTTAIGTLQGSPEETTYGSSLSFKGIPYAQPPVQTLRFKPPQASEPWEGIREVTRYGASCLQSDTLITETDVMSEDCLTLNIWTPAEEGGERIRSGDPRAVMVWIHGGGFTQGSGSFSMYNGARLSTRGDVVVVTLNYRLGVLGFLNTRRLLKNADEEESNADVTSAMVQAKQVGNFGIQDQLHALQWIQDHIHAFGGDPNRVTVFGESAGGFSICALLGSPLSEGLFHQAIIESGGGCNGFADLGADEQSEVEQSTSRIIEFLGCDMLSGQALHDCLESRSTEAILESTEAAGKSVLGLDQMGPSTDGVLIQGRADRLIQEGAINAPKIMVGSNADEMTLFTYNFPISLDTYEQFIWGTFGLASNRILTLYPAENDEEARTSYNNLLGDLIFVCPSLKLASTLTAPGSQYAHEVWVYHFMHTLTNGLLAPLGATHALEIPFVFNNYHLEFYGTTATAEDRTLSDQMSDAWLNFAKTGNPSTETLDWPPYRSLGVEGEVDDGVIMRWRVDPSIDQAPFREGRCHELEELNLLRGIE